MPSNSNSNSNSNNYSDNENENDNDNDNSNNLSDNENDNSNNFSDSDNDSDNDNYNYNDKGQDNDNDNDKGQDNGNGNDNYGDNDDLYSNDGNIIIGGDGLVVPTLFPSLGVSGGTTPTVPSTTVPVVAPTNPSSGTTELEDVFENPVNDVDSSNNNDSTNSNDNNNNNNNNDNDYDEDESPTENEAFTPTDPVVIPSMPPTESPPTMSSVPVRATEAPTVQPTKPPTVSIPSASSSSSSLGPTTNGIANQPTNMIGTPVPSKELFQEWTWSSKTPNESGGNGATLLKGIPGIDQSFGQAIAFSGDGDTLAVGSPDALGNGIVRIYQLEATMKEEGGASEWKHTEALLGRQQGDKFGTTVALSQDGRVLAVGEPERDGTAGDKTGSVRTYVYSPVGYVSRGPDLEGTGASDHFGLALALSKDGMRLAIGAPYQDNSMQSDPSDTSSSSAQESSSNQMEDSGARNDSNNEKNSSSNNANNRLVSGTVIAYEWSTSDRKWIPLGSPLKGTNHLDWFGWSLDLNDNGDVLCVGSPRNQEFGGHVRCFELEDESSSYALSSEFDGIVTNSSARWVPIGDVILNDEGPVRYDDNFGATVKVSTDPTGARHRVAIGSPGKNGFVSEAFDRGQVVVYEFNPAAAERGWIQLGREVITPWQEVESTDGARDFQMGFSLDLRHDLLAVGMPGANDNTGMVEVFEFERDSWRWVRNPSLFEGRRSSSSYYGAAISMTPDGDFAVGSPQSEGNIGSVHIYHRDK